MAAVRITLGLLWLSNLGWKIPPNFGQGTEGGLYLYVTDAVSHPVLPPYSWVIEHLLAAASFDDGGVVVGDDGLG